MAHPFWPLALVVTFCLGWAAAGVTRKGPDVGQLQETVTRLQQQTNILQTRLRAREEISASLHAGSASTRAGARSSSASPYLAGNARAEGIFPEGFAPREGSAARPRSGAQADRAASSGAASRGAAAHAATVEGALDRFYRYLDATAASSGRERWALGRQLVDDLRAMGDVGAQALMRVLSAGTDSDERRAAAQLLGALQVPEALPLLRDILDKDGDVLLRRAAASALRQLGTPDAVSMMERLLANPEEDRLVRLSAAYGLAGSGRAQGVSALGQIFDEANADGRGREMAFRALAALDGDRALPFMRHVLASDAEPSYRLRAIQYLMANGDRQAIGTLHVVMQSPNEQPSIRDAAARAYRALGGR